LGVIAIYGLHVDRNSAQSLTGQLIVQLREAILEGRIKCGERLPPTRLLAKDLNIARNIVIQTYEQLLAEGYLESHTGSGTYVADLARERALLQNFAKPDPEHLWLPEDHSVHPRVDKIIHFNPGTPDLSLFPRHAWAKLLKDISLAAPDEIWGYGSVLGEPAFRHAVAGYLYRAKGLESSLDQLMITSGTAQGTALAAHLFFCPGCAVIEEDPCDCFTRHIFAKNGYRIIPIPVDQDGMCTEHLPDCPGVKLIYAVPSHQFPGGGVLPVRRRLDLIAYARRKGAYIIEDDYDSEFRFTGGPIQPLQQLAPDCVIYMGTFSKTFSPGIRLGFMLLPPQLKEGFALLKDQLNLRTPSLIQLAMAQYLDSKSFDRHVYKMKKVYESKRKLLISALKEAFGEKIRIRGEHAGLHLLVEFQDRSFGPPDFENFRNAGVIVEWVEDYTIRKGNCCNQLVMGYGGLTKEELLLGVERLRMTIQKF
jgi:GntR family transcriptional regulator/MocR family aminotransferase